MDDLMALNVLRRRLSDLSWSALDDGKLERHRVLREAVDLVDETLDAQMGVPPFDRGTRPHQDEGRP